MQRKMALDQATTPQTMAQEEIEAQIQKLTDEALKPNTPKLTALDQEKAKAKQEADNK